MWVFHNLNDLHPNIPWDWVSVWNWTTFKIFFYGLFILFAVIAITLFVIIKWKKELFTNRVLVVSLSLSVYSLAYTIWFTVFFAVLWVGGSILRGTEPNTFKYSIGSWIILLIVLFPVLFFSFIGNTIWFQKRKRKYQSMDS